MERSRGTANTPGKKSGELGTISFVYAASNSTFHWVGLIRPQMNRRGAARVTGSFTTRGGAQSTLTVPSAILIYLTQRSFPVIIDSLKLKRPSFTVFL